MGPACVVPPPATASVPPALVEAVGRAAQDLSSRAEALSRKPEVERSLQGGGIAVNRLVLFSAARQTMEGAAPTNWIALADPLGTVHAWWGDAPASLAGLVSADGFGARWSATALTLVYRRSIGEGRSAGIVYSARSFPVEAPDFGRALDLSGESLSWEPVAQTGAVRAGSRRLGADSWWEAGAAAAAAAGQSWRGLVFAAILLIALLLVGRARDPVRVGGALALAFLAIQAREGSHVFASGHLLLLAVGLLLLPFLLARLSAGSPILSRPLSIRFGLRSGSPRSGGGHEHPGPGAGKPAALLLTRPVGGAVGPGDRCPGPDVCRGRRGGSGKRMTVALLFTVLAIVSGLAFVSPSLLLSRRSVAPLCRRVRALVGVRPRPLR